MSWRMCNSRSDKIITEQIQAQLQSVQADIETGTVEEAWANVTPILPIEKKKKMSRSRLYWCRLKIPASRACIRPQADKPRCIEVTNISIK